MQGQTAVCQNTRLRHLFPKTYLPILNIPFLCGGGNFFLSDVFFLEKQRSVQNPSCQTSKSFCGGFWYSAQCVNSSCFNITCFFKKKNLSISLFDVKSVLWDSDTRKIKQKQTWFWVDCRCLSEYDFGERIKEKFAAVGLQADRFGTHFNLMAENYWLENEHSEIDRLLHLLTVTFSLYLCLLSSPLSLRFFAPWHWWDETQIRCQNKQEIYQSPEMAVSCARY